MATGASRTFDRFTRPSNLALVVLWVALLAVAGGLVWAANGDLEVPASVTR
jgi:hypothetical protein